MFDGVNSNIVELDLRGEIDDVLASVAARLKHAGLSPDAAEEEQRGPGRPKLGVVSREIV